MTDETAGAHPQDELDEDAGPEEEGEEEEIPWGRWALSAGAAAVIMLAAFWAYWPSIGGQQLWDDDNYISWRPTSSTNHLILGGLRGLRDMWLTGKAREYFPVTNSLFWLEWRLWGQDLRGYHAVSILFHALASVLIWRVLRRLAVPWPWLGAMLFAVHPVGVASVAWMSELKNCVSIFFYAAAVLVWLRFEDDQEHRGYKWALVLFVLALLSKPSGVALPLALLIFAWWRRGGITRLDLRRVLPFFAASLIVGLIAVWAERTHSLGQLLTRPEGFPSRLAATGWIVWFYFLKDLVPTGLAMVYPRWIVDPASLQAWGPLAALLAALGAAWWFRRSWGRPFLVVLTYSLVALLPVLGLVGMMYHIYSLVSDHFQYLVLPAVMALVAGALGSAARRGGTPVKVVAGVLGLAAVLACMGATRQRAEVFRTVKSFWADSYKNPDVWVGRVEKGIALMDRDPDAAIAEFQAALRFQPNWGPTYNILGTVWLRKGDLPKAIDCFHQAIDRDPNSAPAYKNLGTAYARQQDFARAAAAFRKALDLRPDLVGVPDDLARALAALKAASAPADTGSSSRP